MGSWCSGLTRLPVTEEIAGSNPVGPAIKTAVTSVTAVFIVTADLKRVPVRQMRSNMPLSGSSQQLFKQTQKSLFCYGVNSFKKIV